MRAVIYARCSTEEESQKDALANQVKEAKECVSGNGWMLVDTYIESKSGTTTKGRQQYSRLYSDLQKDIFDVIVIKSQDRLMRNTKDWYLFIDRLVTNGKKLYIYIENKFYTPDDALITGIKAILAEDYSRELSKKINNAHRNRQKNGTTVILTSNAYGFQKLPDKSIVLIEEEAEIKRKMYRLCAEGFGCGMISHILEKEGIYNRRGKPFSDKAILRIIRNPLNKGTAIMNRVHFDFDSKHVIQVPEEEQYIHENAVPATVSSDLWEKANHAVDERREKINHNGKKYVKGSNPGKYDLSGKLYCGYCRSPYYRRYRKRGSDGKIIVEWKCSCYIASGRTTMDKKAHRDNKNGCDNINIDEEKFYTLLEKMCRERYQYDRKKIIEKTIELLKRVINEDETEGKILELQKREKQLEMQEDFLVDKLLNGTISDHIYRKKQEQLEQELEMIRVKRKNLEETQIQRNTRMQRIEKIEKSLNEGNVVEKATVDEMLTEIDRIYIYPDYMEVVYQSLLDSEDGESSENTTIRIDYGNLFDYFAQKKEDREQLLEIIRENPQITAKEMAATMGWTLGAVHYKLNVLKKEGIVRFERMGKHGEWICKSLSKSKLSIE